eukprot:INCI10221.2.p1 GENE.INCI10221.2~~INCI10221.2.p1  ORF type:complete len:366 (+),score=45.34 INCI10221.2:262-1359(+)
MLGIWRTARTRGVALSNVTQRTGRHFGQLLARTPGTARSAPHRSGRAPHIPPPLPQSRRALSSPSTKKVPAVPPTPPTGGNTSSVSHLPLKGFATGALAGAFGSWVGLGGGFVSLPILTMVLRLTQHQAHGTSLCAVTATGFAGAVGYATSGHIDLPAAAVIASAGMLTAGLGARAAHALSASSLQKALGVFMMLVAPTVPLKDDILAAVRSRREVIVDEERRAPISPALPTGVPRSVSVENDTVVEVVSSVADVDKTLSVFADACLEHVKRGVLFVGAGSGFLAGLFGVGGGAVTIPALTFVTEFDHHTARGLFQMPVGCVPHFFPHVLRSYLRTSHLGSFRHGLCRLWAQVSQQWFSLQFLEC